jgi:DNA topoisomerase IA
MSLKIEDILNDLESADTPEQEFANGLSTEKTASATPTTPAGVMSIEEKTMPNNPEIAYDQAKLQEQAATGGAPAPVAGAEKEAATRIISSLYDKYFG